MTEPTVTQKSKGGVGRVFKALRYSLQGLRAAVQHEAAFRQELLLVTPLALAAPWVARSAWELVALLGVLLAVLVVELLNSGLEALADAVSLEQRPLLGRAKDLGSAAVLLTLLLAAAVWGVALWQRFGA
jgi:diacylglycerol kinase (ATP)